MHKKALVLAVGAALMMPGAFAATKGSADDGPDSVVELYGKLYPEMIRESGKGATEVGATVSTLAGAPTGGTGIVKRNEMESSNSYFGVRGSEKLGAGLRGIFQLETIFLVDSNTSAFA